MDLACLPKAAQLASLGARNPRWHPGTRAASHNEVFASPDDGGGAGALLAFACNALRQAEHNNDKGANTSSNRHEKRAVLWVQDKQAIRQGGRPYRPGLPETVRHRLIHVAADNAQDALFALEEGLRCRDLACVIGEIAGNPREMDFTASRRLSLVAQRHGIPLFLLRVGAKPDLSSARMRWLVRSVPSAPPLWDQHAPGHPAWHAQLFRARLHAPGEWILRDDTHALSAERSLSSATPDHGDLVREVGARSLAAL